MLYSPPNWFDDVHASVYLHNSTYKSAFGVERAGSEHLDGNLISSPLERKKKKKKSSSHLDRLPVDIVLATIITNTQPSYSLQCPPVWHAACWEYDVGCSCHCCPVPDLTQHAACHELMTFTNIQCNTTVRQIVVIDDRLLLFIIYHNRVKLSLSWYYTRYKRFQTDAKTLQFCCLNIRDSRFMRLYCIIHSALH